MEEQTLAQSIAQLLSKVPAPVRTFVLNELPSTTQGLMDRYKLHVDHGDVLETELLLMLLGQSKPEEFVKALTDAGISQEVVKGITADVNKEVFVRLRDEERKESETPPQIVTVPPTPPAKAIPIYEAPVSVAPHPSPMIPVYSPLPTVATPPPPIEKAIIKPVAPKQVPPPQILPGQMPERPIPPPPPPTPTPIVSIPVPEAQPLDTNARVIHTMARDMKALKDGVDPIRVAHPAPPAWVAAETSRPQAVATVPAPTQPTPERESPEAAMRTHLKQYGVDPYREPMQ